MRAPLGVCAKTKEEDACTKEEGMGPDVELHVDRMVLRSDDRNYFDGPAWTSGNEEVAAEGDQLEGMRR